MTSFLTSGIGQRWKTAFVFPMLLRRRSIDRRFFLESAFSIEAWTSFAAPCRRPMFSFWPTGRLIISCVERFIVIHYNELGLKKGNRDYFENRLCFNINSVLNDCGAERARRISGRVLLPLKPDAEIDEIKKRLAGVFGVAYFAEAWTSPQGLEDVERNAWSLIEGRRFSSFRI